MNNNEETNFAEGDRVVRLSDGRSGTVEGADATGAERTFLVEMDHGEKTTEPAANFRIETEDDRSERGPG